MSSKRNMRRKQCDGKKKYNSATEAEESMRERKRLGLFRGAGNVYRCHFCAQWHVGHMPRAVRAKTPRYR